MSFYYIHSKQPSYNGINDARPKYMDLRHFRKAIPKSRYECDLFSAPRRGSEPLLRSVPSSAEARLPIVFVLFRHRREAALNSVRSRDQTAVLRERPDHWKTANDRSLPDHAASKE